MMCAVKVLHCNEYQSPCSCITSHFVLLQYTISGKKVEVAVKKAIMGQNVVQKGALINPDSLQQYYNIKELEGY